jgi:hypothetical protein
MEVFCLGIGQTAGFAGDGRQQGAELDALGRESCLFQDVTDFGLSAAAVIGRPHAKRAVHRVGQISDGEDGHDFIS